MVQEESESRGRLTNKLDDIKKRLDEMDEKGKKKKEFKLPFGITFGAKAKTKKGYAIVLLLRTNRYANFKLLPIDDDMIYIKERKTFHKITTSDIMWYKKYPLVVLPEWSLVPLSPSKHYEETVEGKQEALPQKVVIDAMEKSQQQLLKKSGAGIPGWIWLVILGVVAIGGIIWKSGLIK